MTVAVRPECDYIIELFEPFGPVTVRNMFGAAGIFADGVMLGIVSDERVYLKTDAKTRAAYVDAACKPFTYRKPQTGETIVTSYYALPEALYDEPVELAEWARRAHEVALHSPSAQKRKKGRLKR